MAREGAFTRILADALADLVAGHLPPPRDTILDDRLPLAARFDLLHVNHPTAICRRDREAIMAALRGLDALAAALDTERAGRARQEATDAPTEP